MDTAQHDFIETKSTQKIVNVEQQTSKTVFWTKKMENTGSRYIEHPWTVNTSRIRRLSVHATCVYGPWTRVMLM